MVLPILLDNYLIQSGGRSLVSLKGRRHFSDDTTEIEEVGEGSPWADAIEFLHLTSNILALVCELV